MAELKLINIKPLDIKGLPIFYRKLYYNKMVKWDEEKKIIKYNVNLQTDIIRSEYPRREISKTINYKILNTYEK